LPNPSLKVLEEVGTVEGVYITIDGQLQSFALQDRDGFRPICELDRLSRLASSTRAMRRSNSNRQTVTLFVGVMLKAEVYSLDHEGRSGRDRHVVDPKDCF
jgi:hypothetical protein